MLVAIVPCYSVVNFAHPSDTYFTLLPALLPHFASNYPHLHQMPSLLRKYNPILLLLPFNSTFFRFPKMLNFYISRTHVDAEQVVQHATPNIRAEHCCSSHCDTIPLKLMQKFIEMA